MDLVGGDGKKFDAIELYSCFPVRAQDGAADARARRRRAADRDRRPHLLRRAAQHLHDACGLRDGAQAARRRASSACSMARAASSPSITALVLSRQAPSAGAGAGHQRAGGGRPAQGRGAGVRHGGLRQGQGREFYGALWRQGRSRARRGDAAHRGRRARAGAGAGERQRDAGASAATWTARRWDRSARSPRPEMACWSGGWGDSYGARCERAHAAPRAVGANDRTRGASLRWARATSSASLARCTASEARDSPLPLRRPASPTPSPACPWRRRRRRGPGRHRRCRPGAR